MDEVRPEEATFETWVVEALDALPEAVRDRLGSVAIVVEDWPSAAQLATVGAPGLYGLYQGVPRSAWGADAAAVPSKITIFRGTISRAHPGPDAMRAKVIDTVHHEIAHHLGISDARLREIGHGDRRPGGHR